MELHPEDLTEDQIYAFMVSSILPRPIAWVSTVNGLGVPNLAPFSYYTGVCCDPMTLLFCPVTGPADRPKKDTLLNLEEVPEFVVNVAEQRTIEALNLTAAPIPAGESEFDLAGVVPAPSSRVRPPRVREAALAFECTVRDVIEVNPGPGGGWIVIGTVQAVHVDDAVVDPRSLRVDREGLAPVARLGGADFLHATDVFTLRRHRDLSGLPAAVADRS